MTAPVRTRRNPEVRRKQIIDEAIRLIGLQGYYGFTIQELASRCGITNGGLLYYFPSKEALLIAILDERDRRESEIVPAGITFEPDASGDGGFSAATVLRVLRAIVARSVAQPELIRLIFSLQLEALNPEHPAHDYFQRREAMVLNSFAELLAGHVVDPRVSARCVLALMDGLSQQWLRAGCAFDLLAMWDEAAPSALSFAQTPRSAA